MGCAEALRANARLVWWTVAAMAALTIASYLIMGLRVDASNSARLLAAAAVYAAVAWFYRDWRQDQQLYRALEAGAQMMIVVLLGLLLTYPAMAVGMPYRDAELHLFDQWIGLDRRAYLDFVNTRLWLAKAADFAYMSNLPQTVLIPLMLILARQLGRLQQFIVAFALSSLLTIAISVFFPAVSAFVYLDLTPAGYANIASTVYTHVPTLEGLRNGTMQVVPLHHLEGLLTFPSFHTSSAILYAWAAWRTPYVRWAALGLNIMMLAATPVNGAHYFVDLIGGAFVAAIALLLAQRMMRTMLSSRVQPLLNSMQPDAVGR
jgi:membrane-associated phospholipid phosphatase